MATMSRRLGTNGWHRNSAMPVAKAGGEEQKSQRTMTKQANAEAEDVLQPTQQGFKRKQLGCMDKCSVKKPN